MDVPDSKLLAPSPGVSARQATLAFQYARYPFADVDNRAEDGRATGVVCDKLLYPVQKTRLGEEGKKWHLDPVWEVLGG